MWGLVFELFCSRGWVLGLLSSRATPRPGGYHFSVRFIVWFGGVLRFVIGLFMFALQSCTGMSVLSWWGCGCWCVGFLWIFLCLMYFWSV